MNNKGSASGLTMIASLIVISIVMILFLVFSIYMGGLNMSNKNEEKINSARYNEFYYLYDKVLSSNIKIQDEGEMSFVDANEAYISLRDTKYLRGITDVQEKLRSLLEATSFEYWDVTGVGISDDSAGIPESFIYSLSSSNKKSCGGNGRDIVVEKKIEGGKIAICAGGRKGKN